MLEMVSDTDPFSSGREICRRNDLGGTCELTVKTEHLLFIPQLPQTCELIRGGIQGTLTTWIEQGVLARKPSVLLRRGQWPRRGP